MGCVDKVECRRSENATEPTQWISILVAHITMLQRHLSTIIVIVPDYQCMSSDCTWLCIESRSSGELWLSTWEIEQLYDIMKCSSIKHFWEGSFQPHQVKNRIQCGQFQMVRRISELDAYFHRMLHHIIKFVLDRLYKNTISTSKKSSADHSKWAFPHWIPPPSITNQSPP